MNFLGLVRDLARESGTLTGGPLNVTTVQNATGRVDKLVSWTAKAWLNIQTERDWPWMRREFTKQLTANVERYTGTGLALSRFSQWVGDDEGFRTFSIYDPAIGKADQGEIEQVDYDTWRRRYGRGVHDANRPTCWAVSMSQEIVFGPTPDKAYMVAGEYRVLPQLLAANNDVPEMPEQYHGAIVWEALKLLGFGDGENNVAGTGIKQYEIARQRLERDYLPRIMIGGCAIDA